MSRKNGGGYYVVPSDILSFCRSVRLTVRPFVRSSVSAPSFENDFPDHFKKIIVRYKNIGYITQMFCDRLYAWLLIQSRLTTLLTSLIARRQVGPQTE